MNVGMGEMLSSLSLDMRNNLSFQPVFATRHSHYHIQTKELFKLLYCLAVNHSENMRREK